MTVEARHAPDQYVADTCIIGAGSSGVTVAKALKESGVAFDCFEKGSDIGGMWRYQNDNGLSSAYASLHIDTSRGNLGYSDFPIPEDRPDFLSHADFLKYLEDYADRFGMCETVTFNTSVTRLDKIDGGGWRVSLSDGSERRYRTVVVANGHLWDPRMARFAGSFSGEQIHSHHYRTADPFEGKRVLVVGLGNSAVDIAVDLCRRARHVTVSTRRSAWIMPKYLMGRPVDLWTRFLTRRLRLSAPMARRVMSWLIPLAQGDQRRFGLPRPAHPMWREHATLSQDLLPAIGHGRISIKPDIERLDGEEVAFVDGTREPFDSIILATGYRTSFPFLPNDLFDADTDIRPLYRRIVSTRHDGLLFAGLVQPIGPTIPLVEIQGRWIAALLSGRLVLPSPDEQHREIEKHRAYQRRTFLDSERYGLEVDFKTYAGQLGADMKSGRGGT
ncbi:MAG: NAD(P)-binding domain-containing protein [Rhizobiaceae bacterium]|nr:NAD(P)-binding domain-containing protein [Rhizobiaceae bacterium]MCV0408985.1 NAD(P)-binding domain-containing protein [Rhizobiaceae bacterium]